MLNISCIFPVHTSIAFSRFWIIFNIVTLNCFSGSFPISSSFMWSYKFLSCSSVCNIFLSYHFFNGWDCVPLSLVVCPENSSTGVCRQLCRARSRCCDVDLQGTSLQIVFHEGWVSLLVQLFGLGASTPGAQALSLAHESRSCKLHGTPKNKEKKKVEDNDK